MPFRVPSRRCLLALTVIAAAGLNAQQALPTPPPATVPMPERPPVYDLPTRSIVNTRNLRTREEARESKEQIPDPSLFDGSGFDPEPRPDRGVVGEFEVAGSEPTDENVPGPGEEPGGGGDDQQNQSGLAQMGGMGQPSQGAEQEQGGGGGGEDAQDSGSSGGEEGQPGAGPSADAPKVAAAAGQKLVKPGEVQLGDQGAKLAEVGLPEAPENAKVEASNGEDRMSVRAASGNQTGGAGRGAERGIDIPSNL